jgi:hypothetical protein
MTNEDKVQYLSLISIVRHLLNEELSNLEKHLIWSEFGKYPSVPWPYNPK